MHELTSTTAGVPLNQLAQIREHKLPVSPALSAGVRNVLPPLANSRGGFTPPNSVAVFSFHLQIIPREHGLSPIALTRKNGRMQLPRQLIREQSLKKNTGRCSESLLLN